jgi:hypothetical protein
VQPLLGVPDAGGDPTGRELERLPVRADEDGEVRVREVPPRGHRKRCAMHRTCIQI